MLKCLLLFAPKRLFWPCFILRIRFLYYSSTALALPLWINFGPPKILGYNTLAKSQIGFLTPERTHKGANIGQKRRFGVKRKRHLSIVEGTMKEETFECKYLKIIPCHFHFYNNRLFSIPDVWERILWTLVRAGFGYFTSFENRLTIRHLQESKSPDFIVSTFPQAIQAHPEVWAPV